MDSLEPKNEVKDVCESHCTLSYVDVVLNCYTTTNITQNT